MPTYEYKCPNGHVFEKTFPRISSQRFAKCPQCGKRAERQISGGAGIVFKGSGFYQTDYKRKEAPPSPSDKAEKTEQGGKADTTADAKPKKKDSSDK
jgi:putative FmdB family regulatory protein